MAAGSGERRFEWFGGRLSSILGSGEWRERLFFLFYKCERSAPMSPVTEEKLLCFERGMSINFTLQNIQVLKLVLLLGCSVHICSSISTTRGGCAMLEMDCAAATVLLEHIRACC
jgi:hypothetical protein